MSRISGLFLAAAVGLMFGCGAAMAQQRLAASAPSGGAFMPHDCKSKHDYGAEKGMSKLKSLGEPLLTEQRSLLEDLMQLLLKLEVVDHTMPNPLTQAPAAPLAPPTETA